MGVDRRDAFPTLLVGLGLPRRFAPRKDRKRWIPACAGMTEREAGMTEGKEARDCRVVSLLAMTFLEKVF